MGKATILIVEDDAILAMDLQGTISQQGYTVVGPFASGEEAIAFLPGKQVDLVLMDIELAGEINGIGTAEIIHSTTDIPIVLLTSFSQNGLLAQAKTAAPYGYLIKPVPERELVATLEMSLHRYSLDRQLKESQIALAMSEEKYRQLFENSPLGIFRTTLDGRVLAVNSEMARIAGCTSPEEAIFDFTNLADQFYVDPEQRRQFITQLTAKGSVLHFEFEGRKKNGETLWISLNANLTKTNITNGQSGELVIDGFALDITDRKRTEETLRNSEAKFRSLAESSRDYIMRYDREGRHTYMNPSALAISGLTEADILGKTHRDCGFPEELCALWEEKIMQVFATGEPCQVEFAWNSVAGPTYLDWQLTPEHDAEDRVFSVLGVSRDITERKQLEKVQVFLAESSSGNEVEPFFYALARFLAENLRMDFVCIDRLKGDGLTAQTVAVWCDGHFEGNVSYALKDTPCGEVDDQQICCYPGSVCRLFPNDPVLRELRAESYAGVTILDHTGQPIGLIAIISRQPLKNRRLVEHTLKMVAVRAAGEMERLDAEQALRTSENLLRDITANIPGALYKFVRHQDGSFAMPFISEGASQLLGQPLEVLQDASRLFSNLHPDDMPGVWSSISESADAMSKWRQEFRILLPTGEIHWLQGTSQPSRMDDGGICWNGVLLDITERKQVEQNYQTLFREMLNGFALHEIICNEEGKPVDYRFLAVNPAFEHMTGLLSANVVGRSVREVIPGIEDHWIKNYGRVAITGEPAFFESTSGDLNKNFEVTAYRPAPNQFACIFVDITERKSLQLQLQQAQKMEAIGTLAGGIAHDFNNILGAVLGYAELARDDSPAGSLVGRDINQVIKASHRAKDLVKRILAFSRQAECEPIFLQPAIVVEETLKMLRSSLPSTIAIHQNLAPDTGAILADPTQIHQIIMNLCTNAFHAMEETGGILSVTVKTRSLTRSELGGHQHVKPGDFVHIAIGDTGKGIVPEIRDKIFDPFFTTKEVGKGTGMGLSIVHGIVKSCGGFVSCESQPGKGTVFHINLPTLPVDHPLPQMEPIEIIPIGSERILFVDDEPMLSEMAESMLQRLGYHVTVRGSSREALSSFQNEPNAYDLVITDQTMPGMTGMDMARRMLQIRPGMPIILCTGYSTLISEEKVKSLGIKGFAMKPLAKKHIATIIRQVLDEER